MDHVAPRKDPRIERTKRHDLLEIIVIALCGVISGANSWVEIAEFGQAKAAWLKQFLRLPNGIPSHDTFGRVFALLDPQAFQQCFLNWVQTVSQVTQGEVVAIEGQTLRRSFDRRAGKHALHLLDVAGCLVTIDASGSHPRKSSTRTTAGLSAVGTGSRTTSPGSRRNRRGPA